MARFLAACALGCFILDGCSTQCEEKAWCSFTTSYSGGGLAEGTSRGTCRKGSCGCGTTRNVAYNGLGKRSSWEECVCDLCPEEVTKKSDICHDTGWCPEYPGEFEGIVGVKLGECVADDCECGDKKDVETDASGNETWLKCHCDLCYGDFAAPPSPDDPDAQGGSTPDIKLMPSSLSCMGGGRQTERLIIANVGTATLMVEKIELETPSTVFALEKLPGPSQNIEPDGEISFEVVCNPGREYSANKVLVYSNDPDTNPAKLPLDCPGAGPGGYEIDYPTKQTGFLELPIAADGTSKNTVEITVLRSTACAARGKACGGPLTIKDIRFANPGAYDVYSWELFVWDEERLKLASSQGPGETEGLPHTAQPGTLLYVMVSYGAPTTAEPSNTTLTLVFEPSPDKVESVDIAIKAFKP